jgi:hypothetical protein
MGLGDGRISIVIGVDVEARIADVRQSQSVIPDDVVSVQHHRAEEGAGAGHDFVQTRLGGIGLEAAYGSRHSHWREGYDRPMAGYRHDKRSL